MHSTNNCQEEIEAAREKVREQSKHHPHKLVRAERQQLQHGMPGHVHEPQHPIAHEDFKNHPSRRRAEDETEVLWRPPSRRCQLQPNRQYICQKRHNCIAGGHNCASAILRTCIAWKYCGMNGSEGGGQLYCDGASGQSRVQPLMHTVRETRGCCGRVARRMTTSCKTLTWDV